MKSFLSRKLATALLLAVTYGAAFAAPIVYNAPTNVTLGGSVDILPTVTSGGACTSTSNQNVGISADRKTIYSCVTNQWRSVEGTYWRDPVANFTALSAITTDPLGAARLTRNDGRVYSWNGAAWTPAAIDQNGNLNVPGALTAGSATISGNLTAGGNATVTGTLAANGDATVAGALTANGNTTVDGVLTAKGNVTLGRSIANTVTVNSRVVANYGVTVGDGTAATALNTLVINRVASETAACSPNGAVARDANGLLLSCQSSVWKKASGSGGKILSSDIQSEFCPSSTVPIVNGFVCQAYYIDAACKIYRRISYSGYSSGCATGATDGYVGIISSGRVVYPTAMPSGSVTLSLTSTGLREDTTSGTCSGGNGSDDPGACTVNSTSSKIYPWAN